MDMTEKNGQPSMEEILASIRRIIAEEPADSISLDFKPRTGPTPGNGAEHLAIDDAADFELPSMFRAPVAPAEKPAGAAVKLMDALRSTPQLMADVTGRAQPEFPLPSNFANGHETQRASWADPAPTLQQALSSLRPTQRLDAPATTEFNGHAPAAPAPIIEQAAPSSPSADSIWSSPEPVPEQDVVRQMVPFRDQHFTRMRVGVPSPQPAQVEVAPVAPVVAFEPIAETVARPNMLEAPSFATLAAKSNFPPPLVAIDLGTAPPALPASEVFGIAPWHAPADVPQSPVSLASFNGAAAQPAAGGAIEDATAELLRPMLRQWLSDNMPRMVEKALHIEVAESVKPGKKPGIV